MCIRGITALACLCVFAAAAPVDAPAVPPVSEASPANPCESLNASSLGGYRNLIGKALSAARTDANQNGSDGAYAVAATNARNLLQRAYDKATEMVEWNRSNGNRNPNLTTYAEGDHFKGMLRAILDPLPVAAHWASISAVYHRSEHAREAFDGTIESIRRGNELMGEAGRCFMSNYFNS